MTTLQSRLVLRVAWLGAVALTFGAVIAVGALARPARPPAPDCPAVANTPGKVAAIFLRHAERRNWRCTRDLATARVRLPVELPRPLRHHHVFYAVGDRRRLVVRLLLGSSREVMPAYKLELVNLGGGWRVDRFGPNA